MLLEVALVCLVRGSWPMLNSAAVCHTARSVAHRAPRGAERRGGPADLPSGRDERRRRGPGGPLELHAPRPRACLQAGGEGRQAVA
eukprot:scaffold197562_cov39-Prasinocladus_malaysianus.AAC.1